MPDFEATYTALLPYRMYLQGQRNGTVTAERVQTWNLTGSRQTHRMPQRSPLN